MGKQERKIDFEYIDEQPTPQQEPTVEKKPETPVIQFEYVDEEPVKKKDEEKSYVNLLPSSGLDEHGQPSGIPTVENSKKLKSMQKPSLLEKQAADLREMAKQKPMTEEESKRQFDLRGKQRHALEELVLGEDKVQNPIKTGAKSFWNVLSNQLPSSAASSTALTQRNFREPGEFRLNEGLQAQQKETEKLMASGRKQLLNWAAERQQKGAAFTKDLVSSLNDVHDPIDAINYVMNAAGQATAQIPATIASGGATSVMQGVGDTYLSGIQRVARDKNLTIEEVMDQNLDQPLVAAAFGTAIFALDKVGAGKVLNSFGQQAFKQSLRARAKDIAVTTAVEAQTEYLQTGLQQISDELASGKSIGAAAEEVFNNHEKAIERRESFIQGGIGGGALSGAGHVSPSKVIQQKIKTVDVNNEASLTQAANEIQNSVDNVSNRQTQEHGGRRGIEQEGPGTAPASSAATPGEATAPNSTTEPAEQVEPIQTEGAGLEKQTGSTQEEVVRPEPTGQTESIPPTTAVEDASTIREDQGSVPQSGEIPEGSQIDRSGDIQQETPGQPVNGETVQQAQDEGQDKVISAEAASVTKEVKTTRLKIADRILNSDANEAIKSGIREQGPDYVPKGINTTNKEAKDLIEYYGDDKSELLVRDQKNDLTSDTRTALTANLYEKYKSDADKETDPIHKQQLYNKAVDVALFGADLAKEAGRAVNANKIWKLITGDEESMVIAMEKQNRGSVSKYTAPVQKKLAESKIQFDEEMRKIIAQKVTEGVETQLARAKLITKEKRQQISDFFEKAKVSTKGTANDITRVVGAAVWNGSMEAVKRAVLAGADVANAVQAGLDYITTHYKGQDFKPEEYLAMMTPQITPLIPTKAVAAEGIEEKVKVPGLKGKKKKDFISSVVNEYNEKGNISDEKFEELYAKQIGYREYTDEERTKIREIAKVIVEFEKFASDVQSGAIEFTRKDLAKHDDLLKKAQKANQDLQEFARQPSRLSDTLIAMMQGNLLTTASLVTNVYSNAALQPLRAVSSYGAFALDRGISLIARMADLDKAYKANTVDIPAFGKDHLKGAWSGLAEGLFQLYHGQMSSERDLRDIQSSFNPKRAIKRWGDADRTKAQKINDAIEGTLGWHSEVMFRLLNLGDKPYRKAAELSKAMQLAKKKGLSGDAALKFIMFPDEQSATEIRKAGDEATFQQENDITKFAQKIVNGISELTDKMPVLGGFTKVLVRSQIPYVRTPINMILETLAYAAPDITAALGVYKMAKGDKAEAVKLLSKAAIGYGLRWAATQLFTMGLLSAEDDDDKKGRNIQYDTVPPKSINVSALARMMAFQGLEIKDDDAWINYDKLGVLGTIFDTHTNNLYKQAKEGKNTEINSLPESVLEYASDVMTSGLRVGSASIEKSFLQGTNAALQALQEGGGEKTNAWLINTMNALSSIAYPNTIGSFSKSHDEYIRDTYNRDFGERLKATFQAKMFMGDKLPPKVNLWGEKVRGNPEGRNKYVYYLFDPTKFKNVDTDSYKYKLYEAWKNDSFNNKWLPSAPDRSEYVKGVNMKLTPSEFEKLSTYVGEERARAVQAYVNSTWKYHSNEKRLDRLKDIYSEAAARGKKKFLMDEGWNVLTKAKLEQLNKNR